MMNVKLYQIEVIAVAQYLVAESRPEQQQHVFAYTITIQNTGTVAARLLSRHWYITDANGHVEEVEGEGVIGKQPYLKPGEKFEYTSYALLPTPVGSMHGSYQMITDDGQGFEATIPAFSLAIPSALH